MLPDRVSNPGPLTYESGVLPIALRGPAIVDNGCTENLYFSDHTTTVMKRIGILTSDDLQGSRRIVRDIN